MAGCFTYPGRRVRQWKQEVVRGLRQHKEQPDFSFCGWKSKFPLVCIPEEAGRLGCLWVGAIRTLLQGVPAWPQWWQSQQGPWGVVLLELSNTQSAPAHPAGVPECLLGAALVASAGSHMSGDPATLCPRRRDTFWRNPWWPLTTAMPPPPCRTAATAAAGTRSAWPVLPGSSRTAGDTMAASPACPVPSSIASRSPTAQPRPMLSAGSACRGERGHHGHTWERAGRGWAGMASPGATHNPTWDLRGAW